MSEAQEFPDHRNACPTCARLGIRYAAGTCSHRTPTTPEETPVASTQAVHPPLTAEEFAAGAGYKYEGVPIIEDENGAYVYTHGHVDKVVFATAANAYDAEECGVFDFPHAVADVQHVWAVTEKPPSDPEGWWVRWGGVTAETPQAFRMTVVPR